MRKGILAGGNWIVDHVKLINTWPTQDSLATIDGEVLGNGGAPYNVLKDLALLRAPFPLSAVGLIGEDAFGHRILDDCRTHGIDTAQLHRTAQAPTSYCDVMTVQSTGRRTFFHCRGTNALLGSEHFDFTRSTARHFHLGYLLLLDRLDAFQADGLTGAAHVLRAAQAAGLTTSLDCVSDNSDRFVPVAQPALPHVDYFFANDFEAARLTGISLDETACRNPEKLGAAAEKLLATGVRRWVFVHSTHGVAAAEAREAGGVGSGIARRFWQPAVRVPPSAIKGAAGAGDALAAGILLGLHEGWPIERCLRLGVCAAAASLYDATCSASVRSADECLALGAELGFGRENTK